MKNWSYFMVQFPQQGGYMAAKINKLENQYKDSVSTEDGEEKKGLFSGVAIFVNGYTGLYCDSAYWHSSTATSVNQVANLKGEPLGYGVVLKLITLKTLLPQTLLMSPSLTHPGCDHRAHIRRAEAHDDGAWRHLPPLLLPHQDHSHHCQ